MKQADADDVRSAGLTTERDELGALRKESAQLRMENELLKKSHRLPRGADGSIEPRQAFRLIDAMNATYPSRR